MPMNKKKNMKNLSNTAKIVFTIICYLSLSLFFNSCKDDDTQPNCGCDSETLSTIPNDEVQVPIEEQKSGLLFFKHPEKIDGFYDDEQYNNRFWIVQGTDGCYNCQRHFIICNENLLGTEYDYLKQQNVNDSIKVKFTGKIKSLCILRAIPADYNYGEIVLTSLEQQ